MNADTKITQEGLPHAEVFSSLVKPCFQKLTPHLERSRDLRNVLDGLAEIGDKTTVKAARQLKKKLMGVEPSVTMIGQVKAGKTSLVNAMIGCPDLLPADVNPWTSVVTSLHMSPDSAASESRARFTFFDSHEWDNLVVSGGRVGELAGRAGANDEVEKVRRQVAEMQEKSRRRLGRKFELLLGQSHEYGYFDHALVERYVCLGDDFEDDHNTTKDQGRFADITKSADIFMHRPELPMGLCIRDTPGVNDTFMMREQITIRAIRDSRLCVVVLSAHQALSSVDMALIRLIANVKSREVIIFVNRIDELSDPKTQIPEIEESIRATLRSHHGPEDAQIIFGSAYWANNALTNAAVGLADSSADALLNWAEDQLMRRSCPESTEAIIWELSGIPALFEALSDRVSEGVGREITDAVARNARNLTGSIKTSGKLLMARKPGEPKPVFDQARLTQDFKQIGRSSLQALESEFDKLVTDFGSRVDRSHQSFLDRATASLIKHLEIFGDTSVWKYDPTGLRVLLRTAYQVFSKRTQKMTTKVLEATAAGISKQYVDHLGADPAFRVEPPAAPRIPSPVLLGQTIALDLQANWWSRWWRKRRGYQAYAAEFTELVRAETDPISEGLKVDHASTIRTEAIAVLSEFLNEQFSILSNLAQQSDMDDDDLAAIFGGDAQQDREAVLEKITDTLGKFAA